ncbi:MULTISPECIES: hypothetical protein [Limnospira]|uniref:Uncharacterized protein n=1 Tax=Limnospira fusiformis PMC 851.14 TaxID=2219512 RepID=A0ABU9ELE0_LIMFS|nr:hypothetical protein [Limnospira sp. PMC 1042.18]MDT9197423.1 hypothetical protein [Limnospira sp. PMC 1042.18]
MPFSLGIFITGKSAKTTRSQIGSAKGQSRKPADTKKSQKPNASQLPELDITTKVRPISSNSIDVMVRANPDSEN